MPLFVCGKSWPQPKTKYSKHTYLLTYLLTPWSRVLLEKLTGFAANQEIPRILWNPKVHYRTHKRLALSWANSIQSPQPLPTSRRSILILSSHLRLGLPNCLFPSGFPSKTLCTPLPSSIRVLTSTKLKCKRVLGQNCSNKRKRNRIGRIVPIVLLLLDRIVSTDNATVIRRSPLSSWHQNKQRILNGISGMLNTYFEWLKDVCVYLCIYTGGAKKCINIIHRYNP